MIRPRTLGHLFLLMGIASGAVYASAINLTITGGDTGSIAITASSGLATSITGTFDGSTINSIFPVGGFGNDNAFSSAPPYFDSEGISFSLDTPDTHGYVYVNLWYNNGAFSEPFQCSPCTLTTQGNILTGTGQQNFGPDIVTVAPEPATLPLIGFGLTALGFLARWHTKGKRV